MISSYLTDRIDIITEIKDEWGVITSSTQTNIKARIEDTNTLVRNNKGEEVTSSAHLIIAEDAILTYESRIKIKTKNSEDHQLADKTLAIFKLTKAHGFTNSHYEAWLG